ncbi:hypothetical protein MW887_000912 [Aspergillus wentii]|nr:hypothetical protein MW887_000912 [Aspergillus wentii]
MPLSLSDLPTEILYLIFKRLDRPSKLSLGLTGPHFLTLFAAYYDLDRYRNEPEAIEKLGYHWASWDEPAALAAVIRYLAMSGHDHMDDPAPGTISPPEAVEPVDELASILDPEALSHFLMTDEAVPPPYKDTEEGKEDLLVQCIVSDWLETRFNVQGGCILCAECCRWVFRRGPNGRHNRWAQKMLNNPV